jgi:phage shock protein PspC (stress-responsive transcriptional regulator)
VSDKRLYRSRDDRMVSGVAGGIAEYFDMDPTIVRLLWVAATLLTSGVVILIYVIMAIVVPEAPAEGQPHDPRAMSSDDIAKGAQAFGNDVSDAARRYTKAGAHTGESQDPPANGAAGAAAAAATSAGAGAAADAAASDEAAVSETAAVADPAEPGAAGAPESAQPSAAATPAPAHPTTASSRHERRGAGGLILGGILVFVGITLLVQRVTGIDLWSFFGFGWRFILPALIIAFGVLVILRAVGRR